MDLTTQYLGLTLRNPLIPSASPISNKIDNLKRMEEAGAAAIVLESLFEEQIRVEESDLKPARSTAAKAMPKPSATSRN
mgnify:CR=1 FL=1